MSGQGPALSFCTRNQVAGSLQTLSPETRLPCNFPYLSHGPSGAHNPRQRLSQLHPFSECFLHCLPICPGFSLKTLLPPFFLADFSSRLLSCLLGKTATPACTWQSPGNVAPGDQATGPMANLQIETTGFGWALHAAWPTFPPSLRCFLFFHAGWFFASPPPSLAPPDSLSAGAHTFLHEKVANRGASSVSARRAECPTAAVSTIPAFPQARLCSQW